MVDGCLSKRLTQLCEVPAALLPKIYAAANIARLLDWRYVSNQEHFPEYERHRYLSKIHSA
ncbi:hypothetical protein Bpfe_010731 [Biomphalaria pfeifferi]|uniref:Uncharacterized protein n=1 Tax=Biomphalaria pfeifferi TaxID=112525 RepID=A0AAD8BTN7_BIOPF|nr:hypothetical protein Bpfe_010731 [Biomphalaria pfeifferi]